MRSELSNFKTTVEKMKIEKSNKSFQYKQVFLKREILSNTGEYKGHLNITYRSITADEIQEQIKRVFGSQDKHEKFTKGMDDINGSLSPQQNK